MYVSCIVCILWDYCTWERVSLLPIQSLSCVVSGNEPGYEARRESQENQIIHLAVAFILLLAHPQAC